MLDWREGMILDRGGLDDDHRRQHGLIQRFVTLPGMEEERDRALDVLEELRTLTLSHFAREERVQAAIRYPHCAEHRAQHRRMAGLLNEIIQQMEARESIFRFSYQKAKADELLQFWFFDHFAKADLRMKQHLARFIPR